MKISRLPLLSLLATMAASAQDAVPAPTPAPAQADPGTTTTISVRRTAEELEQLLGPIALYPDALIALILPASTVPTDIVLAARHLRENPGDRGQIEHRAWDESVKSLTNYPDVVKWMDENLHWTQQVGEAFSVQPADVMQAIQRLRAKARAAGTLVDTPQQQVITDQQAIRIVPAQPNTIYVPQYEPEVVFVDSPVYSSYPYYPYYYTPPFLTFGVGVPVGSWLAYDCDWRHNSIWVGNRHRHWKGHDWRHPLVPFAHHHPHHPSRSVLRPEVRQWRPPPVSRITVSSSNRFRSEVARPAPFGFANPRSQTFRDSNVSRSHVARDSTAQAFRGPNSLNRSGGSVADGSINRSRRVDEGSVNRGRGVDSLPVVPPLRNFTSGARSNEDVGPQVPAPLAFAPPLPTARALQRGNSVISPRTEVPQVQSPPLARRSESTNGVRDFSNRSRSFRSSQPVVSAPLPVAPAIPMTTPARSAQSMGPSVNQSMGSSMNRSFARRESAPTVVPPLPIHNSSGASAVMGPVARQITPRAAPPAQSAPAAQAAPVTQGVPAPQSAPAPRGNGGGSRGHRGSFGRGSL